MSDTTTPNPLVRQAAADLARANHATAALVAKARADIEARWTMALHRPRNLDQVRVLLLKECRRPTFADAAIYHKPVGDGVEGLSIRFAEAAARMFGNVAMDVAQIHDDETTRIMRVSVTDLESNVTWPMDVTIGKSVERRQLRRGQIPLGQRTNNYGDLVFLVEASDDDLLNKQNALVSKALRTCILRVIPGDIQDEAFEICKQVLRDTAAKDPDSARRAMCDGFATLNVFPNDLEQWLGHPLASASPVEVEQLRRTWVAVKEGEATWAAALEMREAALKAPAAAKPAQAPAPKVEEKPAAPSAAPAPAESKGTAATKEALKKSKSPLPDDPAREAAFEKARAAGEENDRIRRERADAFQPKTFNRSEDEPGWMKSPG